MRPICWLHISDIHLRASDAWSQDVVLRAMCEQIEQQRAEGTVVDFILVTGDIAFSGKSDEYALAADFFDAFGTASGVPKERIFCVSGNHDIDRERQKLCFVGARAVLQNQSRIDALLAGGEDLETLLKRQENYRQFQTSYFADQERTWTEDGLAYVSWLMIEDVRLAIVGLDSAWLAEGGIEDHGRLLIGERQIINAIELVKGYEDAPHVVVGMAHHPFHLLTQFDRRPAQERIERICHFFQCGHLHEPEVRASGYNGSGCLTLAAGASFETRQSNNTFSVITLDLLEARRTIKTLQYNPGDGAFSSEFTNEYPIEVTPADTCSVSELAQALKEFQPVLAQMAHYLSALLLNQKAELPIPAQNVHTFGSFAALQDQDDSELKQRTVDFMAFRNALRVLYKGVSLSDILNRHGAAVCEYGEVLQALCHGESEFKERLAQQEQDARMLASAEPSETFSHTGTLLAELAAAEEWTLLRHQAQRHVDSSNSVTGIQAKRMLALSLAHSVEPVDKEAATELYRSLAEDESAEISDIGNLATLLAEAESMDEAKNTVLRGIMKFPAKADYFSAIGQKIIEATGDKDFRKELEDTIRERGKRD